MIEHLAKVELFSACTKRELQRIGKAAEELTIPAGTTLTEQGKPGTEAYVLVSGQATAKRNGRKVITFGPGDIMGELSLFDHGPRTATITADTDLDVLLIDARHFTAMIDELPSVAHKVLSVLAGRLRTLDRQVYG